VYSQFLMHGQKNIKSVNSIQLYDVTAQKTCLGWQKLYWRLQQQIIPKLQWHLPDCTVSRSQNALFCFSATSAVNKQTNNQRTAALCLPETVPSTAHARTRTTDTSPLRNNTRWKDPSRAAALLGLQTSRQSVPPWWWPIVQGCW